MITCEGCLAPMIPIDAHAVCMPCVRARHRAALTHRCHCPKRAKRPRYVSYGFRAEEKCDRCLGTIRALPDPPRRRGNG